jgi:hypothetical protein
MARARRGGRFVAWIAAAAIPLLAAARCAHAQRIADLPPPATTSEVDKNAAAPTLVVTASVASLDAVSALTKDIGPGADIPFLSADFIEQRMPFIGPGGLAHNRPLGVLFYVGKDFDLERSLTFVLPVNPGKAELKSFTEKGAQPVAGRTDLVSLESVGFRRTKDQFVFGQIISAVASVREDVLTSTYAGSPNVLARVDFDVTALKKSLPDRYEAFFTEIDNSVDTKDSAGRAGADLVTRLLREVTRLGLSVSRTGSKDGGVRLAIRVEPFGLPRQIAPAAMPSRPGFPEGTTIFRADLAYPPATALGRVTDTIKAVLEGDAQFGKLSPQHREQARSLASGFIELILGGQSGSLGVESTNGQIVAHWITQRPNRPIDMEREMRALVQQATDLAKSTKDAKPVASYENYAAAQPAGPGGKIHRLVLLHDGQPELYLDAIARDATVFMSVAQTPGKFVERLPALQPEGQSVALVSGWVDLGALSSLGLLPQMQGKGNAEMTGRRVAWSAAPEPGALRIDIDLPKPLLQQLPKLVQQLQ